MDAPFFYLVSKASCMNTMKMDDLDARVKRFRESVQTKDIDSAIYEMGLVHESMTKLVRGLVVPPKKTPKRNRRRLQDRFVLSASFCNACLAYHPFEHWVTSVTSVSYLCKVDPANPINKLQSKCYNALMKELYECATPIDFCSVGNLIFDAIQRNVTDPVCRVIDPTEPTTVTNVRLFNPNE